MDSSAGARPKVFGVGLMKTGTSTLGSVLSGMGYRHCGDRPKLLRQVARGDLEETWTVVDRYDCFEDNPWPLIYRQLNERQPGCKFVLTVRKDSDTWYRSVIAQMERVGPTPEMRSIYGSAWPRFRRDKFISYYEQHNESVRAYFAASDPGCFTEVCWETGSTADDVAAFLDTTAERASVTPWMNSKHEQHPNLRYWVRNVVRYAMISGLRYDPRLYENADFSPIV